MNKTYVQLEALGMCVAIFHVPVCDCNPLTVSTLSTRFQPRNRSAMLPRHCDREGQVGQTLQAECSTLGLDPQYHAVSSDAAC